MEDLTQRLDDIAARLERIEAALGENAELRERVELERDARRKITEQAEWLLEFLGDAREEIRWLREQRQKES